MEVWWTLMTSDELWDGHDNWLQVCLKQSVAFEPTRWGCLASCFCWGFWAGQNTSGCWSKHPNGLFSALTPWCSILNWHQPRFKADNKQFHVRLYILHLHHGAVFLFKLTSMRVWSCNSTHSRHFKMNKPSWMGRETSSTSEQKPGCFIFYYIYIYQTKRPVHEWPDSSDALQLM